MTADTLSLPYRVEASSAEQASGLAKAACRDEGWTIRTIASVRKAETDGQWVVTLVVRSKVAATGVERHAFVPLPLGRADEKCRRAGCGPRCYCARCGQYKSDRQQHTDWRRARRAA